jgi:hypothetical protein
VDQQCSCSGPNQESVSAMPIQVIRISNGDAMLIRIGNADC